MKGLRTKPVVQSNVGMAKKNSERWELRLSAVHVVILLGLVTGSMTLSFYLGFFSGKDAGYELAMDQTANTLTKLPIAQEPTSLANSADIAEKAVSEVYAKLVDKKLAAPPEVTGIPALEAIKPLENSVDSGESPTMNQDLAAPEGHGNPKVLGDEVPSAEPSVHATVLPTKVPTVEPAKPSPTYTSTPKPAPTKGPEPTKTLEAKKTEITTPSSASSKLPSGWFAQVAAPTKHTDASDIASKLRKNGFPVTIENADVNGEKYFRVLVGPEENKKQAEALVQQLKRESYLSGAPFIRVVK